MVLNNVLFIYSIDTKKINISCRHFFFPNFRTETHVQHNLLDNYDLLNACIVHPYVRLHLINLDYLNCGNGESLKMSV